MVIGEEYTFVISKVKTYGEGPEEGESPQRKRAILKAVFLAS